MSTERRVQPATRTVFTTSRLAEFSTVPELSKLVGVAPNSWASVIVKECVDNALDAAEETKVAPVIRVEVSTSQGTISIEDNGPGIKPATVTKLLDYRTKTSSREAYVGVSRGAQGNALQSLLAMPFALDGAKGETTIEAHRTAHRITFAIDKVRRVPLISHRRERSLVQSGTKITSHWPLSACSQIVAAKAQIVQIVRDFGWLNPHASFQLTWDGERPNNLTATDTGWRKWSPADATPAQWFSVERFSRLIAAYVGHDQDRGRDRTVREFVAEFRGLARSDAQKLVLDAAGASRQSLREFFGNGERSEAVSKLLAIMKANTKSAQPKDLGILGKAHFEARFVEAGVEPEYFQYRRALGDADGVPYVLEASFGYIPKLREYTRITGVNFSPSFISNPFRALGGHFDASLDGLLHKQRVTPNYPIIFALHLVSPRIAFVDKAKSALALSIAASNDLISIVEAVTKNWSRVIKAEERDRSAEARRSERLARSRKETAKNVAYEVMEAAYLKASDDGTLPVGARQIMYAARPVIQARTDDKQLDDGYFTQTLLPDFMAEHEELTASWDVTFDDRGIFREVHTGHTVGLGTLNVRKYLDSVRDMELAKTSVARASISTRGPDGNFAAILFSEKEGLDRLFKRVNLYERYDTSFMTTKGVSVTAARKLVDELCGGGTRDVTLCILHDLDKAGLSTLGTFVRATRRYKFKHKIKIVDLGLRLSDIEALKKDGVSLVEEAVFDKGKESARRANLRLNGATDKEIEFLLKRRVELNALTSRELVELVERKLKAAGIKKVIPGADELSRVYRHLAVNRAIEAEIEPIVRRGLRKLAAGAAAVKVPRDLKARVQAFLGDHPEARWDAAVEAVLREAPADGKSTPSRKPGGRS